MRDELDTADEYLDAWVAAKRIADNAATRHKHLTAAQIKVIAEREGIGKAKEYVIASDEWLERQMFCDEKAIDAHAAKERFEQAVRRFEASRSEYAATRRVA